MSGGRRLLKILLIIYIVQAAGAVLVGFTLPFLHYFGICNDCERRTVEFLLQSVWRPSAVVRCEQGDDRVLQVQK
jgi:hypothetical protein